MFGGAKVRLEGRPFLAQFMGSFSFNDASGRDLCPPGQKPKAFLAYVLYHAGTKLQREKLVDMFWPDRGAKQGRDSLRQVLHRLRAALGQHANTLLEIDRNSVLMRGDAISFDLWENGRVRWDRRAGFLEDLSGVSDTFERWVGDTERDIRRRQIANAEAYLLTAESDAKSDKVLECVDDLLALDPHHEPAVRAALRVHAQRGDRRHAQRLFERLVLALREDQLEVSPETQTLMQTINREGGAAAPAKGPALQSNPVRQLPTVRVNLPSAALPPEFEAAITDFVDHLVMRIVEMPELIYRTGAGLQDYTIEVVTGTTNAGLRMSLRLEAAEGQYIWSGRSDIEAKDDDARLMLLADKSVMQMLPALEEHFFYSQEGGPETAYGLYIQAKRLFWTGPQHGYIDRVIALLKRAIQIDPDFLPPYGMLIMYYNTGMFMSKPGAQHEQNRSLAYELAQKLLFRNSKYANSHISMAWCHMWQHSFNAAERSIRAAMQLNPYEPHRLNVIGTALVYLGYHDEGKSYYDRAQERIHHDFGFQRTDYGELYVLKQDYEHALHWMEVPETRTPYKTFFFRALAHAKLGQNTAARDDLEAFEADIRLRWSGPQSFTLERAIQWYINTMPLRKTDDRETVESAISALGLNAKLHQLS